MSPVTLSIATPIPLSFSTMGTPLFSTVKFPADTWLVAAGADAAGPARRRAQAASAIASSGKPEDPDDADDALKSLSLSLFPLIPVGLGAVPTGPPGSRFLSAFPARLPGERRDSDSCGPGLQGFVPG